MLRKIVKIDENKCVGCGLCANACHEGAISIVAGKAKLLRDDYCDGLGNCLPVCPMQAITVEEREAVDYNKMVAPKRIVVTESKQLACGCPGTNTQIITRAIGHDVAGATLKISTQLQQWPVQIKLVPVNASYFHQAKLLIAADCSAFAYGNFHRDFMKNKITLIGCPKLDEGDYSEKLSAIFAQNDIRSVTVVKMEVPCCGGIEQAVKIALQSCGKLIKWQVITVSTTGEICN